ncbi:MvaI/BcnI restriction endonuclease family protein [Stenotrophomonas maltophilia]|nr:MvaI/BcnI restriction endonuclease family protein [Stenotrophomonas maltophilia]
MNPRIDERDQWLCNLELGTAIAMLVDNGVTEILYKELPQNANSKNQVYLAPDLSELSRIPSGSVVAHTSYSSRTGKEESVFHAPLELYWITSSGMASKAPEAKLIYYPQYPEVRMSGMLKGAQYAPSSFFDKAKRGADPDRILLLGITADDVVMAIVVPPESPAANEIRATRPHDPYGSMYVLPARNTSSNREEDDYFVLLDALHRIHSSGWHDSIRLNGQGVIVPCRSTNCNGNTLEALLGIRSNGLALPDFRGWEIKARGVLNSDRPGRSVVTLFTPEPDGGSYYSGEFSKFMLDYGHPVPSTTNRLNFGGIFRAGEAIKQGKKLRLDLRGYDADTGRYHPTGAVVMLNRAGDEAMSWSFAKLLDHWKSKHAKAAYVPSQIQRGDEPKYRFGNRIQLGEGAEFGRLLSSLASGQVYYDPGIKLERPEGGRATWKRRSQFRVKSSDLESLYESFRCVDVATEIDLQFGN